MAKNNQGYNGNPNLIRANVPLSLTAHEVSEFIKCKDDPLYFTENYIKIVHVDRGLIPFDMWDFQKKIMKTIHDNRFTICKIPRQQGKSTTVVSYLLHYILFNENVNVAILANKADTARITLGRLQLAFEYLPNFLKQGIITWNKGSIELANGSKVLATSTSASSVRGSSFNCISGESEITLKFENEIFNIPINDFYNILANSSRNIIDKNEIFLEEINYDIFRQEIQWYRSETENEFSSHGENSVEQRIKVLTPEGFKSFQGIKITKNQSIIKLTSNDKTIKCTPDHLVYTKSGWTEAKNCNEIYTKNGFEKINISNTNKEDVFDLLEVKDTNAFFANDILVHNCIFLDEFAHVPNTVAEAFLNSTYPTISSGNTTKVIIVSTPLGLNMFYKIWTNAINKKNEYIPIEVHWSKVPGRDEEWKRQTIENTSEDLFRVEFDAEFVGSTSTLINSSKLQILIAGIENQIYQEELLDVYEHPKAGHTYTMTVDVSQGLGLDASAFSVIDVTQIPYKQVAKYQNNQISPLVYPSVIYNIAKKFNDAFVLVEINDIGQEVADILHYEFGYDNLIKLEIKGKQGQQMTPGFKRRIQLGVRTTIPVKRIGCANLKSLIENDKLILKDSKTIMELTTFSVHNQTYRAEEGNTDDLAMSLVLFSWLSAQKIFKETVNQDIRKTLQEEQMKIMDDDILPAPRIDDGLAEDSFRDSEGELWVRDMQKRYPFDDFTFNWNSKL